MAGRRRTTKVLNDDGEKISLMIMNKAWALRWLRVCPFGGWISLLVMVVFIATLFTNCVCGPLCGGHTRLGDDHLSAVVDPCGCCMPTASVSEMGPRRCCSDADGRVCSSAGLPDDLLPLTVTGNPLKLLKQLVVLLELPVAPKTRAPMPQFFAGVPNQGPPPYLRYEVLLI